jgi:hypothetical protein
MKNIKILVLTLILSGLALHFGCKKDEGKPSIKVFTPLSFLNGSNFTDYTDIITCVNDQYLNLFTNTYTDNGKTIGDLQKPAINDLSIQGSSYNYGPVKPFHIDPIQNAFLDSLFGRNVSFNSSGGTAYSAFTKVLYSPKKFTLSFTGLNNTGNAIEVTKSSGFTVSWNPDSNNQKVAVVLAGDSFLRTEFIIDDALGSLSITSSDLAQYPIGTLLSIYLARGNEEYFVSNGNTLAFRIGTIISTTDFLIK